MRTARIQAPILRLNQDANQPHRSGLASAISKLVGSRLSWTLINALTGIITARTLGASGRGALAVMIIWPVFLAGALTFGLPSALVYRIRQSSVADRGSFFTAATVLATAIGILAGGGGFLLLPLWLSNYTTQVVMWAKWLMVFTVVSMLMLIFRAALEGIGRFGHSAGSWVLIPLQTLASLLFLWRLHWLTAVTAALSYVFAGIPVLCWMFFRLNKEIGWNFRGFVRSSRVLLGYGFRSYGIDLCGALSQYVDQALVVGLIMAADLGRYVVALSLSRTLNAVYQAAATVLFPKCVGLEKRDAVKTTLRITAAITALVAPGAVALYCFGSFFLHLFYGPEYVVATTLLRVLIFEAVLSGITTLISQAFMAMGKPGTVTLLQVVGLSAAIPLLLVLVPKYGILGAGVAILVSSVIRLLLLQVSLVKFVGRFPRPGDLNFLAHDLRRILRWRLFVTEPDSVEVMR